MCPYQGHNQGGLALFEILFDKLVVKKNNLPKNLWLRIITEFTFYLNFFFKILNNLFLFFLFRNLGSTLLPLLEALLVLQEDEYPSVSSTAIEAQYQLRIHLNAAGRVSSLIDILEQGFLQHIVSLPGSIYKLG